LDEHAFVWSNPNRKGAIAEAVIAAEAMKTGIRVLKPAAEHEPYDLAFDLRGRLLRVQCKWANLRGATVCVHTTRCRTTKRGVVRSKYLDDEIDAIAAYCHELSRCYLLPAELATERSAVHLRLAPPQNGQRAAINWAEQYELGAVAQRNERPAGSREVVGSNPTSSTPSSHGVDAVEVGAHEFRNHFGWYMQRAAAGEEFLVRRRGKPYVRLTPVEPKLAAPSLRPPPSRAKPQAA
jgi:prevent-host-death family protein